MQLRSGKITDRPRIEEPADMQEDTSSTEAQVGSPLSMRTRSFSDSQQQAPLTPIPEDAPAPERGQLVHHSQLHLHDDFILYSQSDTDDGTEEEEGSNAYLSSQISPRPDVFIAPRPGMPQLQLSQGAASSSSTHTMTYPPQAMTPQRQPTAMQTQLPTPSQTNMMPHFESQPGPWSPNSPTDAESRKLILSGNIPDINDFPKDRTWDDKMQTDLKKMEQGGEEEEGKDYSDEEKKRPRKRRHRSKRVFSTDSPSKPPGRKDDRHGQNGDRRGGGQGVVAS